MNSLVYIVTRSIKNSLLELPRKPAKLVLYILAIMVIPAMILLSYYTRDFGETPREDILWLKGILFLYILLFAGVSLGKGLSSGDTIFAMNDVNLLFVSPLNPRAVLLYGLGRMIKTALFAGFCILFQSYSLSMIFGLDFGAVLLLLLGFTIAALSCFTLSVCLYSLTSGSPGRKKAARLVLFAVLLPPAIFALLGFLRTGDMREAAKALLASRVFALIPIAGWAAEGTIALILGELGTGLRFLALPVLSGGLMLAGIALSRSGYYEDVLAAAETAFEKKGRSAGDWAWIDGAGSKKAGLKKTGLKKTGAAKRGMGGAGAAALFYKDLRESLRTSPPGPWGGRSILMIILGVVLALILRDSGGGILVLLQSLMWTRIFLAGAGQRSGELYTHYIYLIPEPSLLKILWSSLGQVLVVLGESLLMFSLGGIIMGGTLPLIGMAALIHALFALLLTGLNLLFLRWTGADLRMGLFIFIYALAAMGLMLPGLTAALITGSFLGALPGLGVLAAWETLAALGCFTLSRGILHRCDMPVIKARD